MMMIDAQYKRLWQHEESFQKKDSWNAWVVQERMQDYCYKNALLLLQKCWSTACASASSSAVFLMKHSCMHNRQSELQEVLILQMKQKRMLQILFRNKRIH
jgi:hypothetical protein